jgi:hypothetical protein
MSTIEKILSIHIYVELGAGLRIIRGFFRTAKTTEKSALGEPLDFESKSLYNELIHVASQKEAVGVCWSGLRPLQQTPTPPIIERIPIFYIQY